MQGSTKPNAYIKTKVYSLFIALALLAGVHPALAQTTNLGIAPAGNQMVLFWPATLPYYVLQSTTNLASPNWVMATDAVPVTAVTVSNTSAARFFRLLNATTPDGMALIPAGVFTMGNSTGDPDITNATPTNVTVSGFYMDTNLVSYSQWQTIYAYATSHGYGFDHTGAGKAANHPVQTVDWYDCVKWCNARSAQAGLTPVYYTDAGMTQVYTNGQVLNPYADWTANGYRLPTEAEWEKAARGGLSGQRFPWGNTISWSQANYYGAPGSLGGYAYDLASASGFDPAFNDGISPYTNPVGSFAPNGYGLYDMAGNLEKWCWDWGAVPPYPAGSPYLGGTDPRGPASSPFGFRVLRGGYWDSYANACRSANRNGVLPSNIDDGVGFRCVRGL